MIRKIKQFVGNIMNKVAQVSVSEINDGLNSSQEMKSLCRKAAAESCVLLKNDGILPLNGQKVSVFGRCQINYFYVGYGSGGVRKWRASSGRERCPQTLCVQQPRNEQAS